MSDLLNEFDIEDRLGEGSYGTVWRAIDKHTNETVAIKWLKGNYISWEHCMSLVEIKSLQNLQHPNIVSLKSVFMEKQNVYLVFENMDSSLSQLMQRRKINGGVFTETEVRHYMFQLFMGLAFIHQRGYIHRDLKPDNFLVSGGLVVKIADFGMAREVSKQSPPIIQYVTTRWYRAPEVLFGLPHGPEIDMWAMGCIMGELFTLRPLFCGLSQVDQIYKICSVIGRPNQEIWGEGVRRASELKFQFPDYSEFGLSKVIPCASEEAIDLISSLCSWDPSKRPTAAEALRHPFFASCYRIRPSLYYSTPSVEVKKGVWEQLLRYREAIRDD